MPRRNGQPVGTTPDTRRWWTLAAMALAVLAIGLDLTILSTALPTLARDLHASTTDLQWFANSYTLVLAALMLPAGAVSDRIGPKPLMLGALVVFGAASVGSGLSTSARATPTALPASPSESTCVRYTASTVADEAPTHFRIAMLRTFCCTKTRVTLETPMPPRMRTTSPTRLR